MAELQAPVQLFSWEVGELETIPYAMHHGMMRRIYLPSANPATVPVQQRCRKDTECKNSVIPTTCLS